MTRMALAIALAFAFTLAVWLVVSRRAAINPLHYKGIRRRVIMTALIIAGFLQGAAQARDERVMCYEPVAMPDRPVPDTKSLADTLRAAWITLDAEKGEALRKQIETAVQSGHIRNKVGILLSLAFKEVAYHKERTSGDSKMITCYKMTALGGALAVSRGNALKQITALRNARNAGTVDDETARKAMSTLAREVEMFSLADVVERSDWNAQKALQQAYTDEKISPSDSSTVTAQLIVTIESGRISALSPSQRLETMKKKVEELLNAGPTGNDWRDPAVNPNVFAVLNAAGLIPTKAMVTCYDRMALPVAERSTELKRLQEDLLDSSVAAGLIDEETAAKVSAARDSDPVVETANEESIKGYQLQLRRAIRLLYKRGEVPYDFVRQLEHAADITIIKADHSRALRSDVRYYLASLHSQLGGSGAQILKSLAERKLIPPEINHRMKWTSPAQKQPEATTVDTRMAEFLKLVDGNYAIFLEKDASITVDRWNLPQTDIDYRLRMRRVFRALLKTGLSAPHALEPAAKRLGVPLYGTIKGQ